MQANELREHADMLLSAIPLVPPSHRGSMTAAADYLRACAEALENGPVAWTLQETLDKRETTHRAYLWFVDPQNSAWAALYPVAMPALRLLEPMTDAEIDAAFLEQPAEGVRMLTAAFAAGVRLAERRVKEANE